MLARLRTPLFSALVALLAACRSDAPPPPDTAGAASASPAVRSAAPDAPLPGPEHLTADATDDDIVGHLARAERLAAATTELVTLFPDLDRARAYRIQMHRLDERLGGDRLAGWKIGYSRQDDPRTPLDPVFGHVLASQIYESGAVLPASLFVGGTPLVEAEVAVWLASDLPGPAVTREDVVAAVDHIGASIELVSPRAAAPPGASTTRAHDIADDVFHAGAVLSDRRFGVPEINLATERAQVQVNGEVEVEGRTATIMGRDPIEAVVWLANELPKYGQQLRAGQVVLTGTVVNPPPIAAGDTARVEFTTLGAVELTLGGAQTPRAP